MNSSTPSLDSNDSGDSPARPRRTPQKLGFIVLAALVLLGFWLDRQQRPVERQAATPRPAQNAAKNVEKPALDPAANDQPNDQANERAKDGVAAQRPATKPGDKPSGSNEAEEARDSSARTSTSPANELRPRDASSGVATAAPKLKFSDVTLKNQDGKVIFKGVVDLTETIARIDAGRRLSFPNDGSVFQNREGRLPRKASGYYHEYVHPTPKTSGPGPQRVVTGADGEAYYTHDHYRTFRRIR